MITIFHQNWWQVWYLKEEVKTGKGAVKKKNRI